MNKVIHRSSDRGYANHSWLDTHHTFSFASWYNPDQMNFGVLRVLNDDIVTPQMGFGKHPHADMEIISIPLAGALTHRDSMGHAQSIETGDVQVMSAGTGVEHSEFNQSKTESVNFLQLWIFPDKRGYEPRYDQKTFEIGSNTDAWIQVVKPFGAEGDGLWIHQDAYMHRAIMTESAALEYQVKSPGNGVYFFVIEGEVKIEGEQLQKRDGMGLWDTGNIHLQTNAGAEVLAIEVPMEFPQY